MHKIQIKDEGWTVPSIWHFDVHLMDAIIELQLTPAQLMQLNACHMYLQVTMLVEITDHMGTVLLPQVLTLNKEDQPTGLSEISYSLLDWPVVHLPSRKCWTQWTHTIHMLFTGAINGTQLCHPLGPWKADFQLVRYWKWHMSPLGSLLHQPTSGSPTQADIQLHSN